MPKKTHIQWDYPDHFPAPVPGAKPVYWLVNGAIQHVGWLMPALSKVES